MLQVSPDRERHWFLPAIHGAIGMVAWLCGDFDSAGSHFERASAGLYEDDLPEPARSVICLFLEPIERSEWAVVCQ